MYGKSGLVLRVETVINNPEEFRVRKQALRKGKPHTEWVAMRKGVAYLFRYREVSLQAHSRYLDALAVVDDPTNAKRDLDRVTTPKRMRRAVVAPASIRWHVRRGVIPNPHERRALLARPHQPRHADLARIDGSSSRLLPDPRKESAKVSRTFRRFHAHGLIAKIPRIRRWRVTPYGRRVMGTSLYLRDHDFSEGLF